MEMKRELRGRLTTIEKRQPESSGEEYGAILIQVAI